MDVMFGANNVMLNLDNNQQAFETTVQQLSSGLRINSAADDPSGNAIATNLTSKYLGLQQASENVQEAVNALNVANGALTQVQNILVRVNNLLVEANSDINSGSDLENIQGEIQQLLTEVNTIGEKTNFNGRNLLNGQFDTSTGTDPSWSHVASPDGGTTQVVNADGNGDPGPLINFGGGAPITIPTTGTGQGWFVPGLAVFTVTGYSDNVIDPDSGDDVGPGVYLQFQFYSTSDEAALNGVPLYTFTAGLPVNAGPTGTGPGGFAIPEPAFLPPGLMQNINIANLTEADVGASTAFLFSYGTAPGSGTALSVNDGGEEGTTVGVSLPTVSTGALGISQISVLYPQVVQDTPGGGGPPNEEYAGADASNDIGDSYAQIQVQNALTTITTNEAQIGAQIVAMGIDQSDDDTTANNLQSSQSNITDLNVGQATTDYTREQILTQVGTEVLSQIQNQGKVLTGLLVNALNA
jgi:flagellin